MVAVARGHVLNRRYQLLYLIGGGGMAQVYLARDVALDRPVAVKVLSEPYAGDARCVERFRREARAAARLSHPNIAAVHDVGAVKRLHYIAMDYVPGETLRQCMNRSAPLPLGEAVGIAAQVAAALACAHQHGLVHRDVKPGNVLLAPDGTAKMVDFGIATGITGPPLTSTGLALGTVDYFAPEQARGDPVGPPADLYALGVVLYEMLTGRLPFSSESAVGMALKHLTERPLPPSVFNPAIPRRLDALVLRALAKAPAARFPSAEQMKRALQAVAAQLPPTSPAAAPEPPRQAAHDAPTELVDHAGLAPPAGAAPPAGPSYRAPAAPDEMMPRMPVPLPLPLPRLRPAPQPRRFTGGASYAFLIWIAGVVGLLSLLGSTVFAAAALPGTGSAPARTPTPTVAAPLRPPPTVTPQAPGTATIVARFMAGAAATVIAEARATTTTLAQATLIAQAEATATAQAQGTATAQAAAGATAQAEATATAQVQATAVAEAVAAITAQAEAAATEHRGRVMQALAGIRNLRSFHYTLEATGEGLIAPVEIAGDFVAPDRGWVRARSNDWQREQLVIGGSVYHKEDDRWRSMAANQDDLWRNPYADDQIIFARDDQNHVLSFILSQVATNPLYGLDRLVEQGADFQDGAADSPDGVRLRRFTFTVGHDPAPEARAADPNGTAPLGTGVAEIDPASGALSRLTLVLDQDELLRRGGLAGTPARPPPAGWSPSGTRLITFTLTLSRPDDPALTIPAP